MNYLCLLNEELIFVIATNKLKKFAFYIDYLEIMLNQFQQSFICHLKSFITNLVLLIIMVVRFTENVQKEIKS